MSATVGGSAPRVVFGLPVHNGAAHLAEALESLLAQTYARLAIVAVDDCSTDDSAQILARYRDLDARLAWEPASSRLGLVRAFRRTFELAGERFPEVEYFAWASDHDVWHPGWLECLISELDQHPEAVLAYPLAVAISERGADLGRTSRRFDTRGVADPVERLRLAVRWMKAGDLIYGLYRREPLLRAGPKPLVLLPDRLLLARLAVEGEFRQVPRRLWYRRYRAQVRASAARQRRTLFPGAAPLTTWAPWWAVHTALLYRLLRRSGPYEHARTRSLALAYLESALGYALRLERRRARAQRRLRRWKARLEAAIGRSFPAPLKRAARPVIRRTRA